ncbi:MAG: BON domain-containing protein, partial [Acidobacteriota bacterium]|nr:BON domain-containing protein [Acidobacteriota bacterium]
MSTRYRNLDWERDDDRYGRDEDERGRYYERGLYGARGLGGGGRDYEDYGYLGGAYGGGAYGRGPSPREPREYGREYGRDYVTGEYRRDYGARRGREREGAGRDFIDRGYERSYRRDEDRGGYDTDYGRTTSRFYGRRGEQYERDTDRDEYGRGYGAVGGYGRRSRRDDDDDDDRRERGYRTRGRGDDRGWLDRAADEVRSWFGGEDDDDRYSGRERGGHHRGRGPRNYRRSDERVRDDINDRLTDNDWLDASDIDVVVSAGEVTLNGTVESRYAKRLAEDLAESVSGVSHVQNNLRVKRGWETGMGT